MFRFAFRRTRSPGPSDNYNKISKHDSWRMNTVSWFRQIKSPAFQKALADFGLIGLILLLLFYIRWIYCIFANVEFFSGKMIKDVVVSSNTPAQPLYTIEDNFFPQEQFDEIRAGLISGKLATAKNSLNAKTFGNTSGVVIVFSAKGEARLRRNPKLKDIVTFLDAIRVEGANAYVVNILKAQSSKKEDGAVTSAGAHFDDTLMVWELPIPRTEFISHQTTVLYLNVPDDMEEGRFVLQPNNITGVKNEQVIIHPKENRVLKFRGDCSHHVEHFHSDNNNPRISLVVEQYIIPPEHQSKLFTYWSSMRI